MGAVTTRGGSMKNMNGKINPVRKGKTIASVALTLAATAIMTMMPMSQAQAFRIEKFGGDGRAACGPTTNVCGQIMKVMGGGRSKKEAIADAKAGAKCPNGLKATQMDWGLGANWFWDGRLRKYTWFSADINMTCVLNKYPIPTASLKSSEPKIWVDMMELKKK